MKAPSAGHLHGLQVTAGQQVSDGSFLFSVQVSHVQLNTHDMGKILSFIIFILMVKSFALIIYPKERKINGKKHHLNLHGFIHCQAIAQGCNVRVRV